MKDPQDSQTSDMLATPPGDRKARYRKKREQEGYRQVAMWIHQDSAKAGAEAAAKGDPCEPQSRPVDLVSWVVGWAKETDSKK